MLSFTFKAESGLKPVRVSSGIRPCTQSRSIHERTQLGFVSFGAGLLTHAESCSQATRLFQLAIKRRAGLAKSHTT